MTELQVRVEAKVYQLGYSYNMASDMALPRSVCVTLLTPCTKVDKHVTTDEGESAQRYQRASMNQK